PCRCSALSFDERPLKERTKARVRPMSRQTNARRTMLSWNFVGALFVLCGVLGALQYRWIGEVSVAARERLRGGLQASLTRLSQDLNAEIAAVCSPLLPAGPVSDALAVEEQLKSRFPQSSPTARHAGLLSRVAV